jgi:multisubunit Na+/H+ antiporter MnhF subunit
VWAFAFVLLASLLGVVYALVRGPHAWDRLLAYNAASNRIFVLLALISLVSGCHTYLDATIVYAMLSFLGVIILARFMERGEIHR